MSRPRSAALIRDGGERVARLSASTLGSAVTARAIAAILPRRFDPDQARDLEATLELRLRGAGGGAVRHLALHVDRGELSVSGEPAGSPQAVAEVAVDDVVRLAAGATGWPKLIAEGRMSLSGDPFLALRFPAMFRLPVG